MHAVNAVSPVIDVDQKPSKSSADRVVKWTAMDHQSCTNYKVNRFRKADQPWLRLSLDVPITGQEVDTSIISEARTQPLTDDSGCRDVSDWKTFFPAVGFLASTRFWRFFPFWLEISPMISGSPLPFWSQMSEASTIVIYCWSFMVFVFLLLPSSTIF